jgi:hypothetical protein
MVSRHRPQSSEVRSQHLPGKVIRLRKSDSTYLLLAVTAFAPGFTGNAVAVWKKVLVAVVGTWSRERVRESHHGSSARTLSYIDIAGILTLHVDGQRNLCGIVVSDMKIDMLNIRLVV